MADPMFTGPFWKATIGQIGTGAVILATCFIGFGKLSAKLDIIGKQADKTEERVDRMDESGTQASRRKTDMEAVQINGHETRIQKVEELVGDVKVIKDQVQRIGVDLQELKAEQRASVMRERRAPE